MYITGDPNDAGADPVEVIFVPMGEPDYNTEISDAGTGEVLGEVDTGGYHVGIYNDVPGTYSTYQPPGADYYLVMDEEGNVVGQEDVPPDKEWGILGIVKYYDDGTVTVSAFGSEVSVDVIGGEGGITIDIDAALAEVSAGLEWEEDGSWTFDASVDVGDEELGNAFGADLEFGQDENGNAFLNVDTYVDMNVGFGHLEGGQHLHVQQTDDGFEASIGLEGTFSAFGAYVSHDQRLDVVLDDGEVTGTYYDELGAGIKGLGGIEITSVTQVHTDGTWGGSSATQGAHGAVVDEYGNAVAEGGAYADTDGEVWTQEEILDNEFEYNVGPNQDDFPAEFDGGADFKLHDGSEPDESWKDDDGAPGMRGDLADRAPNIEREGAANGPGADRSDAGTGTPRDVFDDLPEFGSTTGGNPGIARLPGDAPERDFGTAAGGDPNVGTADTRPNLGDRPDTNFEEIKGTATDTDGPADRTGTPDRDFGTTVGGDPNVGGSAGDRPGVDNQPNSDQLFDTTYGGDDRATGDPSEARPGMTDQPDGDFLEFTFTDVHDSGTSPDNPANRPGLGDRPDTNFEEIKGTATDTDGPAVPAALAPRDVFDVEPVIVTPIDPVVDHKSDDFTTTPTNPVVDHKSDDITAVPQVPAAPQRVAEVETAIPGAVAPVAEAPVVATPEPIAEVETPVLQSLIDTPVLDAVEIPEAPSAPMVIAEPDAIDMVDGVDLDDGGDG